MTSSTVENGPGQDEQASRLERFKAWVLSTDCRPRLPDEPSIAEHPVAQELIRNDGSRTYVVHGANPQSAELINEAGFKFRGFSTEPNLESTAFMLEAPDGALPQEQTNELLLEYRRETMNPARAKVVMEFPFERPSTKGDRVFDPAGQAPFDRTPLSDTGPYIQKIGEPFDGEQSFLIPRTYVKGWFDLETGEFHTNPHFGEHERTIVQRLRLGWRALSAVMTRRPH